MLSHGTDQLAFAEVLGKQKKSNSWKDFIWRLKKKRRPPKKKKKATPAPGNIWTFDQRI
jgi:hypothetical protein